MDESLLSQLYLKDTAFQDLMRQRIYNVLLVANNYDAFMLEEDGRIEEQIYFEYVSLNLSSPPRVTHVSNYDDALAVLAAKPIDLIVAMPGVDIPLTFDYARRIKHDYPTIPMVVLTPFSREVSHRLASEDTSVVDYVFSWLGNMDLLVAIIKLIEDKMNAADDVNGVGVQLILMVEDSVRFYSSVLPTLYRFILNQSRRFSTEALNAHEAMLRMRGRPKVMLARDYEEAVALYEQYGEHVMGVVSDVSFMREGVKDKLAGIRLAHYLRERDPHLPIIIESSEAENRMRVQDFDGVFLDKNSKKLPVDLGHAIMERFGFGDFIIRNPQTGHEIMRIHDLNELQYKMFDIPDDSLFYHARRNDISRWLYSRALFPIAQVIKMHRFRSIDDAPAARQLFFDLIVKYRKMKNRGVVAEYRKERFDKYSNFARIGQGSLGGKGRGLAFIDHIIKNNPRCDNFDGVPIGIPHTVVLCTDIFDEFMEANGLYPLALSDVPDQQILDAFLQAILPERLQADFKAIYDVIDAPLAVRSSSLLEDSHYQPFAGVYATYMIPHLPQCDQAVALLGQAVKAVYASVFFAQSKAYMNATANVIDQEKMAVIIQEVVGQPQGDYYYPSFSGVARSLNYYPIGDEQPEQGVCELAVGLGKYIVDGGLALRFSPQHPHHVLQTSTPQLAMRDTQRNLYALTLAPTPERAELTIDEGFNLASLSVQDEAKAGHLRYMVSSFDYRNDMMVHNDEAPGRKLVTFANVLDHGIYPLAPIVDYVLGLGQQYMGRAVEVEFAGNIASPRDIAAGRRGAFYLLQIRPMVDRKEMLDGNVIDANPEQMIVRTTKALGHGMMTDLRHVVLVDPQAFSFANNSLIAEEIARINCNFVARDENYILVGPGRWGSADEALGIPVKWSSISAARIIVEVALQGMSIEPSQGTHFFQNLTSFGVGYFTVNNADDGSFCDMDFLNSCAVAHQGQFVKVIRFEEPLQVAMNGQTGLGVILKPQ